MQFTYLSYFPLHNTAPFERPSLDKKPISSHCINTALYVCGRVLPSHGEGESKVLHHCNRPPAHQLPPKATRISDSLFLSFFHCPALAHSLFCLVRSSQQCRRFFAQANGTKAIAKRFQSTSNDRPVHMERSQIKSRRAN